MKVYLRKKVENGKINWILETKVNVDNKQRTVYLGTLPPIEKLIELISGKASEELIKEKVEKSLKASGETKRQIKECDISQEENLNIRTANINRTDALERKNDLESEKSVSVEDLKAAQNKIMKDLLS